MPSRITIARRAVDLDAGRTSLSVRIDYPARPLDLSVTIDATADGPEFRRQVLARLRLLRPDLPLDYGCRVSWDAP